MPTTRPDTARSPKTLLLSILAVAIAVCLTAASCGWDLSEEPLETRESNPSPRNVLRWDVAFSIGAIDPFKDFGGGNLVLPLLYSFLFLPDGEGGLQPDLVVERRYDPQGYTWRFRIRTDAKFHDGATVTVEDVAHSIRKAFTSYFAGLAPAVIAVRIVSSDAVEIQLHADDPEFPDKIWEIQVEPSAGTSDIDYRVNPIGSGPFRYHSREGDRRVELVANESYYKSRPSIDGVVFTWVENQERIWTRLLVGETDLAREITTKNYEIMQRIAENFTFNWYTIPAYSVLLFNTHDPLFVDQRVRRAVAHAIDRDYIVADILDGAAVVSNGPMGLGSPYKNPEVRHADYDPEKAMALLKEAGWSRNAKGRLAKDGDLFAFDLLVIEDRPIEQRTALYLKIALAEIAMNVNIVPLPMDALGHRIYRNRDFQAALVDVGTIYRNPGRLHSLWCSGPEGEAFLGCFSHPDVNRLVEEALAADDLDKRKTLLYEVDRLLNDLQPGVFLYQGRAIDVISKRFIPPDPFTLDVAGIYRLQYARFREMQE